jgi:hypothetical protein
MKKEWWIIGVLILVIIILVLIIVVPKGLININLISPNSNSLNNNSVDVNNSNYSCLKEGETGVYRKDKCCFGFREEKIQVGSVGLVLRIVCTNQVTNQNNCESLSNQIIAELGNAQKCSVDSDCTISSGSLGTSCYSCGIGTAYNKNYNLTELKLLSKNYIDNNCQQKCPDTDNTCPPSNTIVVRCFKGRCII